MPLYKYQCQDCLSIFEQWKSVLDSTHGHCDCGSINTVKVYSLNLVALKPEHRDRNKRESMLHKDRAAYKRFRDNGHQPAQIDGCDRLEATAKNRIEVMTNGRISVPDSIAERSMADAQDIAAGRI